MVKIDISNRALFVYGVLIVLFLGIGFGVAFGGNEPTVMGHSAGEIEGVCLSDGTNCAVDTSLPTLNYTDCKIKLVGYPIGPHKTYCPAGYVVVGGDTDGNDYIWESIICCKLDGIKTINYDKKP